MSRAGTWLKMAGAAIVLCVGGPAFVEYIRPSEEELFKRYNPDLQKKSLENRDRREKEFDDYVNKLKEWSKSDKSIWVAAQEDADRKRAEMEARTVRAKEEARIQREEMRKELQGGK
ncbi:Assembly factor cbp4 [Paecilomyces lecythidis]